MHAVVVTHDSERDIGACLDGLRHPAVTVTVVDSGSRDGTCARVAERPWVRLLARPDNLGWSAGCNLGAESAGDAPALAFVNPDARPSGADLLALAGALDRESAVTSPMFVQDDGSATSFAFRFPGPLSGLLCFTNAGQRLDALTGGRAVRRRTYGLGRDPVTRVDQPGAACFVVDRAAFRAVDGFDERFFLFFADTDLCLRLAAAGKQARVIGSVRVAHRGQGSVGALPLATLQNLVQVDLLAYSRRHHTSAGRLLTEAGVALLTGVLPALARLARGRPDEARAAVRLARGVLAGRRTVP